MKQTVLHGASLPFGQRGRQVHDVAWITVRPAAPDRLLQVVERPAIQGGMNGNADVYRVLTMHPEGIGCLQRPRCLAVQHVFEALAIARVIIGGGKYHEAQGQNGSPAHG